MTPGGLPAYAKPDLWLDDANCIEFVRWKDDSEPYMAFWWHRSTQSETGWCNGSFAWRNPSPKDFQRDMALWTLEQWEPLTISPSLLCLKCKAHGFIRQSKWIRA